MRSIVVPSLTLLLACVLPSDGRAQAAGFSTGDWKRVETEHFLFLYPEELTTWALPMAARMEAVRTAVQAMVGYAPEQRVTVLMDDPSNVSNGSMVPGPLLFLWPTPPDPRSMIGENRGWAEILAVHEFAHAAHLTRPSRNALERLRAGLLPIPVTRMMRKTPRWATEGYATYIEGRLTGSGRPHGVWRPAVLRTWALEGQLPTYGQLSGSGGFYGGAMAYLGGSAFLEWLVAREGGDEGALPDIWARLTARQVRTFDAAFAGVFGAPPSELYGLFTVDLTERALAVRDAVEAAGGVVEGELFQRLTWSTGDPAVSPDGERLAVVLRSRSGPSRVVVMATTPDTLPTRVRERQAAIYDRDPEDVPPVRRRPLPQRALATLWPEAGAAFDAPAWMPDGGGILVVRGDYVENARRRTDLFLWSWESGEVRRITRGAAIREADPAPDGTWAAGLRCLHGRCDIVRIDLATGHVSTLVHGDPMSPWFRPRVSPDGGTIVASRQVEGRWRLAAMGADGEDLRWIAPDDGASRFDAEFIDGRTLVLASTAGGIPNLELLDLASGDARPLTRAIGAAVAPAPSPGGEVFFLSLHSRGWDLRRIDRAASPAGTVAIDPGLAPAAARGVISADTLEPAPIGPVRGYGLGPRFRTILPMADLAANAFAGGAAITSADPIGILSWQVRGMYGEEDAFRGGAADVVWRGLPPAIRVGAFAVGGPVPRVDQAPSPATGGTFDDAYYGGLAVLGLDRRHVGRSLGMAAGGSVGELRGAGRRLGWIGVRAALLRTRARLRVMPALEIHGATGRTGDHGWTRWITTGSLELANDDRALVLSGLFGRADAAPASGERFTVGGTDPVLLDPALLSQRVPMPALPVDFLAGDEVWTANAALRGERMTLFYWTGDARGDAIARYQLAGAELAAATPAVPYIRLPESRFRAGVARLLEDPLENEWRAWAVLGFRP